MLEKTIQQLECRLYNSLAKTNLYLHTFSVGKNRRPISGRDANRTVLFSGLRS